MSTSGTTVFQLNRDQVISAALRKLGVLPSGGSPSASQLSDGAQALNAMIKGFQADGMPVWAMRRIMFAPTAGQSQYMIGPGQEINTPAPLKVTEAFYTQGEGTTVPLNIYTQYDFNLLPVSCTQSTPVNLYYQPLSYSGRISLWPTPSAPHCFAITLVYQRPFEDMNLATDDFDFPPYWTEALIYGLAWRLSPEYGIPLMDRSTLMKEAETFHQYALSFGTEEGSVTIQPSWDWQR